MKVFAVILLFLICSIGAAQTAGNYILVIGRDSVSIDLGYPIKYKTPSGKKLDIKLIRPDVLTYEDEILSFGYSKDFGLSQSEIDKGVDQIMVMSSMGNGIIIQTYENLDPSSLTRFMLNEIIKESMNYGYKKEEEDFSAVTATGETLKGIKATLTYRGETEQYIVTTYNGKDNGFIIITMLTQPEYNGGEKMIQDFYRSIKVKI